MFIYATSPQRALVGAARIRQVGRMTTSNLALSVPGTVVTVSKAHFGRFRRPFQTDEVESEPEKPPLIPTL